MQLSLLNQYIRISYKELPYEFEKTLEISLICSLYLKKDYTTVFKTKHIKAAPSKHYFL